MHNMPGLGSAFFLIPIINLTIMLVVLGVSVYFMILGIKALKIYIKNNS